MNIVMLIGNLGADPEIRYLPSGMQLARMRLAVNNRWIDKESGQRQEKTHWITLTAFGKNAETCGRYLKKGYRIAIRGSLEYREWVDSRDNSKKSSLEVKVGELEILTSKREAGIQGPSEPMSIPNTKQASPSFAEPVPEFEEHDMPNDDDIPF